MKKVLLLWLALSAQAVTLASDWPQWRGPHGLGVSDAQDVITEWTPTTNIAWKTAIPGRGHSSPIISRGRIFLTTSHKGEQVPGRKAPVHLGFDRKPGYVHPDSVDVEYTHAIGAKASAAPAEETRAVAFLAREVPRWKTENDCYSCHNNGDAARALIVAASRGHDVGAALDDTLEWLRQPQKWSHNKTGGGIDDKPLARVQFAGALRLAVGAGRATPGALSEAATIVAADQKPDGSWQLDTSQSIGSPATYGTTLATWAAKRVLLATSRADLAPVVAKANSWLRSTAVESVIDAAAVVLALGNERDTAAREQRQRALTTLKRGQGNDGGWGPYVTVSAEVFDTALVVLALAELRGDATLAAPVYSAEELRQAISRGRAYLLKSQMSDGSWPETTRPSNQESYAQRISTTGWALLALMESR